MSDLDDLGQFAARSQVVPRTQARHAATASWPAVLSCVFGVVIIGLLSVLVVHDIFGIQHQDAQHQYATYNSSLSRLVIQQGDTFQPIDHEQLMAIVGNDFGSNERVNVKVFNYMGRNGWRIVASDGGTVIFEK